MADLAPSSPSATSHTAGWWTPWRVTLACVGALTALRVLVLLAEPYPLFVDESQYWAWGQDLDWGYYSKPPLVAWLVRATTEIFGDTGFGARISTPFVHAATALVLFAVARRLFDAATGAWTAVAYATAPAVVLSSYLLSVDPALLLFWSIALYCVIRALNDDRLGWWGLAGGAWGMAMMAKYAAAAFPLSLLVYAAISGRWRLCIRPGPYVMLAVGPAVLARIWFGTPRSALSPLPMWRRTPTSPVRPSGR